MENLLKLLPEKPQPVWVRVILTAALVGLFYIIRLGAGFAVEACPVVFIPPILIAAIAFDRGTGFFATALSALAVASLRNWSVEPLSTLSGLGIFVVIGIFVTIVGEGMRKALEKQVAAQQELDLLLQEQGHRIKNDLAIASSLISMQAKAQTEPAARVALETAVGRLHVLAESHDHLRIETHDQVVDMQQYLTDLCWKLGEALRGARPIDVKVAAEAVVAKTQKATRIGLIVNELVTNALKHAFPDDRAGAIIVALKRMPGELIVTVEDDGVGCPQEAGSGLGSKLVRLLVQQLGGRMIKEPAHPGCRVVISIPPPPRP